MTIDIKGGTEPGNAKRQQETLAALTRQHAYQRERLPDRHEWGSMGSPEWAAMNILGPVFGAGMAGSGGGAAGGFMDKLTGWMPGGGGETGSFNWMKFMSLLPQQQPQQAPPREPMLQLLPIQKAKTPAELQAMQNISTTGTVYG